MSVRVALKLFILSVVVFAAAFALDRTFLWDVVPVSWDQEPQSLWALGGAFFLRSVENLSGAVAAITLALACALLVDHRRHPQVPKLRGE